jgi:hypothetical protein
MAVSEVPVASFASKPARATRAGTMTMPPPTPNSPDVRPAMAPTTATRSQGTSVALS